MKKIIYLCAALIVMTLAGTNVKAQTISGHTETIDTTCGAMAFEVDVAGCISGLTVKAYFGDGTSSSPYSIFCSTGIGGAWFNHAYAASGTYSVKMVLYSAGVGIDSVSFSTTVQFCRQLPIAAFFDANSNCVKDVGESFVFTPLTLEVDSSGTIIDTITMMAGTWYTTHAYAGTVYGFRLLSSGSLSVICPSTGIVHSTVPGTFAVAPTEYFAFNCGTSSAFDLALSASFHPALTGGLANKANIIVYNSSCTGTPATVKFEYSPKYTFGSVSPAFSHTVTGNSVTVDVGSVSTLLPSFFTVSLTPVTALVMGDTINTKYTVFPTTGDSYPGNNVVTRCDTVRASYDPNQKSVTPTGNIAAGTRLEYMLEFENTGNDTAYNVHVLDTLSNYLDINTMQIGISTHAVNLIKYVEGGQNILKFDFPNIKLWDSSHHDKNKGMVMFSINAKTTLALGTVIPNRVGIYFDANPVVMTNTVHSKIPLPTVPTGLNNTTLTKVEIYPNPVNDVLNIGTEGNAYKTLSIYNIIGQELATQTLGQPAISVDVSGFTPGIYYVTLRGAAAARTIKFEKQ